jgi:hypothetical protein
MQHSTSRRRYLVPSWALGLIALLAFLALVFGPLPAAHAEDAPPVDPAPVVVEPEAQVATDPIVEETLVQAPATLVAPAFVPYATSARWLLPATWDYATTPTYQAAIFPQAVLVGDPPACRWSQDDSYWIESEAEAALFASLDDDGVLVQGEDAAIYASHVFTPGPACAPVYVTPTECPSTTTLPTATEAAPRGWGDTKGGTWTPAGLQLTAGTEEAYAYLDLTGADQFLLSSTLHGLGTTFDAATATGSFGVIIHTDKANVHYDAGGTYWTTTPGVFPETSPGYYSTHDLAELLQDATIDSVAVWVNPGGSLLLQAQAYNCLMQPFGAELPTPPVVDEPAPPVTTSLALTGANDALLGGLGLGGTLLLLLGGLAVAWPHRAGIRRVALALSHRG